jgi:hypothetical protein
MNQEPTLTRLEARPLSSREMSKVISSLLGGFASWCDPEEVLNVLSHLEKNSADYRAMIKSMGLISMAAQKERPPDEASGLSELKVLQFILISLCSMVRDIGPQGITDLVTLMAANESDLFKLLVMAQKLGHDEQVQTLIETYSNSLLNSEG